MATQTETFNKDTSFISGKNLVSSQNHLEDNLSIDNEDCLSLSGSNQLIEESFNFEIKKDYADKRVSLLLSISEHECVIDKQIRDTNDEKKCRPSNYTECEKPNALLGNSSILPIISHKFDCKSKSVCKQVIDTNLENDSEIIKSPSNSGFVERTSETVFDDTAKSLEEVQCYKTFRQETSVGENYEVIANLFQKFPIKHEFTFTKVPGSCRYKLTHCCALECKTPLLSAIKEQLQYCSSINDQIFVGNEKSSFLKVSESGNCEDVVYDKNRCSFNSRKVGSKPPNELESRIHTFNKCSNDRTVNKKSKLVFSNVPTIEDDVNCSDEAENSKTFTEKLGTVNSYEDSLLETDAVNADLNCIINDFNITSYDIGIREKETVELEEIQISAGENLHFQKNNCLMESKKSITPTNNLKSIKNAWRGQVTSKTDVKSKINFLKKLRLKEREEQPLVMLERLEQHLSSTFVKELNQSGSLKVLRTQYRPTPKRKKKELFKIVDKNTYERSIKVVNQVNKPKNNTNEMKTSKLKQVIKNVNNTNVENDKKIETKQDQNVVLANREITSVKESFSDIILNSAKESTSTTVDSDNKISSFGEFSPHSNPSPDSSSTAGSTRFEETATKNEDKYLNSISSSENCDSTVDGDCNLDAYEVDPKMYINAKRKDVTRKQKIKTHLNDTGIPKIVLYLKGKGPDKHYTCASNINKKAIEDKKMNLKNYEEKSNRKTKVISKSPENKRQVELFGEDSTDSKDILDLNQKLAADKKCLDETLRTLSFPISPCDSPEPVKEKYTFSKKIEKIASDIKEWVSHDSDQSVSDYLPDLEKLVDCKDSSENVSVGFPFKEEAKQIKVENKDEYSSYITSTAASEDCVQTAQGSSTNNSAKVSLSYKHQGKPTAHVEPFITESTFRTSSRKGKGFYDENIPFIIDHEYVAQPHSKMNVEPSYVEEEHVEEEPKLKISNVLCTKWKTENKDKLESLEKNLLDSHDKEDPENSKCCKNLESKTNKCSCYVKSHKESIKSKCSLHKKAIHSSVNFRTSSKIKPRLHKINPKFRLNDGKECQTYFKSSRANNSPHPNKTTNDPEHIIKKSTANKGDVPHNSEKHFEAHNHKKIETKSLHDVPESNFCPDTKALHPKDTAVTRHNKITNLRRSRSLSIDSVLSLFKVRIENSNIYNPLSRSCSLITINQNHSRDSILADINNYKNNMTPDEAFRHETSGSNHSDSESLSEDSETSLTDKTNKGLPEMDLSHNTTEWKADISNHSNIQQHPSTFDHKYATTVLPFDPKYEEMWITKRKENKRKMEKKLRKEKQNNESKKSKHEIRETVGTVETNVKLNTCDTLTNVNKDCVENIQREKRMKRKDSKRGSKDEDQQINLCTQINKTSVTEGQSVSEVVNKQRRQFHERDRGRRLAQEIPGFNWLEEKIRNASVSSSTTIATSATPSSASSSISSSTVSTSTSIDEIGKAKNPLRSISCPSEAMRGTPKPLPALIPSNAFISAPTTTSLSSTSISSSSSTPSSSCSTSSLQLKPNELEAIKESAIPVNGRDLNLPDKVNSCSVIRQCSAPADNKEVNNGSREENFGSSPKRFHLQTAVPPLAQPSKAMPKHRLSPPHLPQNMLQAAQTANYCNVNKNNNGSISTIPADNDSTNNARSKKNESVLEYASSKLPRDKLALNETTASNYGLGIQTSSSAPPSIIHENKREVPPTRRNSEGEKPKGEKEEKNETDQNAQGISVSQKLSILTQAFKFKLNTSLGISPEEASDPDSPSIGTQVTKDEEDNDAENDNDDGHKLRICTEPEATKADDADKLPESKPDDTKCSSDSKTEPNAVPSTSEEEKAVLISIPETLPSFASVLNGMKINESFHQSIFGSNPKKESDPDLPSSLIVALYEELMRTRQEVEKLRKVQEQMLKADKANKDSFVENRKFKTEPKDQEEKCSKPQPPVIDITNLDNSPETKNPINVDNKIDVKTSESEMKFVYEVNERQKRAFPQEASNESFNPQFKKVKHENEASPNASNGNTITIRYNLPNESNNPVKPKDSDNLRLRNLLGISNNELDVVPVDENISLTSVLNQHAASSQLPKESSGPPTTAHKPDAVSQVFHLKENEKERKLIAKLLDAPVVQKQSPRFSLPDLPNLIPSNFSSTNIRRHSESAEENNRDLHAAKYLKMNPANPNVNLRPTYNKHSNSVPSSNVPFDQTRTFPTPDKNFPHPQNKYEVISASEPQSLMSHHSIPILAQSHASYSVDRRTYSPKHSASNDMHAEEGRKILLSQYPNSHREVDKNTSPSQISPKNMPHGPQTFQPKILIPPNVKETSGPPTEWHHPQPEGRIPISQPGPHQMPPPTSHAYSQMSQRPSAFSPNQNYVYRQHSNVRMAEIFPVTTRALTSPPSKQAKPFTTLHHVSEHGQPPQFNQTHQQSIMHNPNGSNQSHQGPISHPNMSNNSHCHSSRIPQYYSTQHPSHPLKHPSQPVLSHQSQTLQPNPRTSPSYHQHPQHRPHQTSQPSSIPEASSHQQTSLHQHQQPHPRSQPSSMPPNNPNLHPSYSSQHAVHPSVHPIHHRQIVSNNSPVSQRHSPHQNLPNLPQQNRNSSVPQMPPVHSSHQQGRPLPPQPYRVPSPTQQTLVQQPKPHIQTRLPPPYPHQANISTVPSNPVIQSHKVHMNDNQINRISNQQIEKVNGEPTDQLVVKKPTSSPGASSKKRCLICPQTAQFLCSGCKTAWYCSKECQREHWGAHSPNCVGRR